MLKKLFVIFLSTIIFFTITNLVYGKEKYYIDFKVNKFKDYVYNNSVKKAKTQKSPYFLVHYRNEKNEIIEKYYDFTNGKHSLIYSAKLRLKNQKKIIDKYEIHKVKNNLLIIYKVCQPNAQGYKELHYYNKDKKLFVSKYYRPTDNHLKTIIYYNNNEKPVKEINFSQNGKLDNMKLFNYLNKKKELIKEIKCNCSD